MQGLESSRKAAVSLPTGSGKTVVFSYLISRIQPLPGQGRKILIIVNRRELAFQTARTVMEMHPRLSIVLEIGSKHYSDNPNADVCIASIASISRANRLSLFNPKDFKAIIIDEAHHAAAVSYKNVETHFGLDAAVPNVYSIGFSATLYRHDGRSLESSFERVLYHQPAQAMIDTGHLTKIKLTQVSAFHQQERSALRMDEHNILQSSEGLELIVKLWQDTAPAYRSTVIFAINREHIRQIVAKFRGIGVDARAVSADMKPRERDETIRQFRQQEFPVIVNCGILIEGTDIPCIDQILIACPNRSVGRVLQMIGRGLRNFPGKRHCNVCVFPELTKFKANMSLEPMLKGLLFEEQAVPALPDLSKPLPAHNILQIPDLHPLDEIELITHDNLDHFFTSSRSAQFSNYNWIYARKKFYLFGPPGSSTYIRMDRNKSSAWEVHVVTKFRSHSNTNLVFTSEALFESVYHAEKMAEKVWGFKGSQSLKMTSSWRWHKPSQAQLKMLGQTDLSPEMLGRLKKGEAASLISLKSIGYKLDDGVASHLSISLKNACLTENSSSEN